MLFLFILMLLSACSFSIYLYMTELVTNPFVYVLLGFGTTVAAHYLSYWIDISKFIILNRGYQAFVVNGEGEFWDGAKFATKDSEPDFSYNDFQTTKQVHKIIKLTGNKDLYVRIMPQDEFEEDIGEE